MVEQLHEESTADCIYAKSYTYKYIVPTDWELRECSSKWCTENDGIRAEGGERYEVDCDEGVHCGEDVDILLEMLYGQVDAKFESSEAVTSPVLRYFLNDR